MNRLLAELINKSENIVFFGGAGVSTESGIPDFRSKDGLYSQKYAYPPEYILSHEFFYDNTEEFFRFYKDKLINTSAKPNNAHIALAKLEEQGKLKAIITQNIDNLHQQAGSKTVFELHGSIYRNYCTKCHSFYPLGSVTESQGIPYCNCGGIIKPDVVLYNEPLNDKIIKDSLDALRRADLLIIGGTSLTVYPAASLINYFGGKNTVVINKTATSADNTATLVIKESIAKALEL